MDHFEFFVNGFYNHINDYIYTSPTGTQIDANDVFEYIQDDASKPKGNKRNPTQTMQDKCQVEPSLPRLLLNPRSYNKIMAIPEATAATTYRPMPKAPLVK